MLLTHRAENTGLVTFITVASLRNSLLVHLHGASTTGESADADAVVMVASPLLDTIYIMSKAKIL